MPQISAMRALERRVQIAGAADEAHRGHAEAVAVERLFRRGDQLGMIGETQIVVGAEIEHLAPARDLYAGALRRQDRPLGLPQRLGANDFELGGDVGKNAHGSEHSTMAGELK